MLTTASKSSFLIYAHNYGISVADRKIVDSLKDSTLCSPSENITRNNYFTTINTEVTCMYWQRQPPIYSRKSRNVKSRKSR